MKALIAVDLAHEPAHVVDVAGRWAARLGARADVAYADPVTSFAPLVRHADLRRSLQDEIDKITTDEHRHLRELAASLPENVRGAEQVWDGAGAAAVAEHSAAYDLVMVGTHGRQGLVRWLLGSSAERIVRWAHAPVLIVRNPPPSQGARILVAVDLRDRAEEVVDRAVPYAHALGARIDLVFVEDAVTFAPMTMEAPVAALVAEHVARRRDHDEAAMQALADRVPAERRGAATVEDGDPAARVAQIGANYDLVIAGTHGRTGLDRWWLGSVAEAILRGADRSVLVLHLGEGANGDARRS